MPMLTQYNSIKNHKQIIFLLKIVLLIGIIFIILNSLFINGLKPYYSYKDYYYQNDFAERQCIPIDGIHEIKQRFTSKGNILNSVSVLLGELSNNEIKVSLTTISGKEISNCKINASEYSSNAWNQLHGLKIDNIEKDKEYSLCFSCKKGLSSLVLNNGKAPIIFDECVVDGKPINAHIAVGFKFTYKYLTLGSCFELIIVTTISILIGIAIYFFIIKFKVIFSAFHNENSEGFLPALFFSVSTVFIFNPLEKIRNEVLVFSRVMGAGLIDNVDVSRRMGL